MLNQIVFVGTTPVDIDKYKRYKDFINAVFNESKDWNGFRYFSDSTYYRVCGGPKSHLRIGVCLKSHQGEVCTEGGWGNAITRTLESGASPSPVYEGQWVEVYMPDCDNEIEVIGEKPATPSLPFPNKAKFEMYVDGKKYRLVGYRLPKKGEFFMDTDSRSKLTKITRCLRPFSFVKCFIFEEVEGPAEVVPTQTAKQGSVGLAPVGRVEGEICLESGLVYSTANERILAREIDNINRHLGRK